MRATCGLLLGILLCAPLCAREQGDFTPRGALLHAKIADAQGVMKKLGGGDDYLVPLERIWAAFSKRDSEEAQAFVDELRPYVKAAKSIEFALGDIMVREPYTQTVTIIDLGEGAPAEFSENVRNWVKKEFGKKAVAEPKAIDVEAFSFRRYEGQLVIATGGMMKFGEDVRAGNLEESLSQVKRFKDWREHASGDLVAFADGKAWRNCIDRLGREVDREFLAFMDTLEWQKWDTLSLSLDVQNGISLRADLTFTEAPSAFGALLKGAGGFTLFDTLPADTLAALAVQLGSDHERTYSDLLRFFHDTEWRMRAGSLTRQIENYQRWLEEAEKNAAKAESEEDKKMWQEQIESYRDAIKQLQEEQALSKDAPRPFEPDKAERRRKELRASEAERFADDFEEFCKESGISRESLFEALGSEAAAGIVGLPDPFPDDNDLDLFENMWFIVARAKGDLKAIKEKFLEMLNKERRPRDGEPAPNLLVGKPVEGGELIGFESGPGPTLFIGEGLVGFAANSEVAKRILLASTGRERLSYSKLPGGLPAGSKAAFIDLGEIIARMVEGDSIRSQRYGNPPQPLEAVRKYLKAGLRVAISDNEGPSRLSFQAQTAGETSLRNFLEACGEDIEFYRALRHDRNEIYTLSNACEEWFKSNSEALAKLKDDERRDAIKAVTLEVLTKQGHLHPKDGLRSAFDPSMADKFKAMLQSRADVLDAGNAAKLDECSFEWFGLPTDEVKIRSDSDYGYSSITDAWLVAASKGSWVRGGRMCLLQSGMNYRVVWLSEDNYNALRLSNVSGGRLKTFKEKAQQPLWKLKLRLWRLRYNLNEMQRVFTDALRNADGSFQEFSFKGADHEDAAAKLRELLKLSEEIWLDPAATSNCEVEIKDKSSRVRIVMDGHWIEIDEKGKITTSWGEE
ncbi:hypothetical protein PLCT1_02501 [Planctomycetaceae bacterium]|nr:hypothetical protein PLCT1_02501 [Planctomycetaceae bacterium]